MEKIIHEAYVARLNQHLHSAHIVKARCHRSQRKNEDAPHALNIEVANSKCQILNTPVKQCFHGDAIYSVDFLGMSRLDIDSCWARKKFRQIQLALV